MNKPRVIDIYLCSSEVCWATAMDLVRVCSNHGVILRVLPGAWLRDPEVAPDDMRAAVEEHAQLLRDAKWDGEYPALIADGEDAGGGEIYPRLCRQMAEVVTAPIIDEQKEREAARAAESAGDAPTS